MPKQPKYIYIKDVVELGVAQSSAVGFVEVIQNLHTLIETISGSDGVQIHVSGITIIIRLREDSDEPFVYLPVVVQTVGSFASQVNLVQDRVEEMIDVATDDVFGYHPLGNIRGSRSSPNIGTNAQKSEITLQLPQHLLALLNKETETERLQNLHLALVGKTDSVGASLVGECYLAVEFTEMRKSIVIR